MGVEGKVTSKCFTETLPCVQRDILVSHRFPAMPQFPSSLLGRYFLATLGDTLSLPEAHGSFPDSLCPLEDLSLTQFPLRYETK